MENLKGTKQTAPITADMTVLDIVSQYPQTEDIFHSYDEQVGECLCCQMLFETIEDVAEKYNLELSLLLAELNGAVA